ncbi:helix-turn-helix domain-containing protein [Paludifilum halophilum]|uniref:Uncharacterized protein n=1 Tax=Paludifilum halophilum TaxID=1642702 RepID=A0A235B928_9BACL|nr:helix-turn-helix transcriptional regulator [Paludifilum halophilum]OYD08761.1 hypothetical protein CHM34_02895 [Paludifilum halophilum]
MAVGNVLRNVREGESQLKFSQAMNVSREAISAYETGRASIPRDVASRVMQIKDDPRFAFEVASEYTGGAWMGWLDNVDLHRSAVREKALEELQEAMEQISATSSVNRPDRGRHDDIKDTLIESIDVIVCLSHLVAVYCQEYGLSWTDMWREHRRKMEERGYIKKKSAPQGAR